MTRNRSVDYLVHELSDPRAIASASWGPTRFDVEQGDDGTANAIVSCDGGISLDVEARSADGRAGVLVELSAAEARDVAGALFQCAERVENADRAAAADTEGDGGR